MTRFGQTDLNLHNGRNWKPQRLRVRHLRRETLTPSGISWNMVLTARKRLFKLGKLPLELAVAYEGMEVDGRSR